ncbi:importin subunit alpha-8 isoform X1 [Peromyscus leucopus]|uniref:importin subunit alpha-8 isoform X1 n=1 Tax=Peromyscus leucopus TaxID=10041 RepID=UPI0010A19CDF|nr:importin subunit alpha-8 isoform X1 [Peromyscus leucopus]
MPALEAPEERLKKFKYRGKDVSARRQERIAANLQLRKAKKDEQALKRRNIRQSSNDLVSLISAKEVSYTLEDIIKGVNSSDPVLCFLATQAARKLLSQERNPPLKSIIEAGLIPKLVEFLKMAPLPNLQFEAAWALTNIASGTSEQTRAVVMAGAIEPLIELLSSPHLTVCEQAVWALGNIAGKTLPDMKVQIFNPSTWETGTSDGPEFRDDIISNNAVPRLINLSSTNIPITFLRNITWTLSNLCRNKNPYPCEQAVMQMLPTLSQLLQHHDNEILSDTCWALSYLTEGHNERIQSVVTMGVLPRLVELMTSSELIILTPSLRTVGNIVTGTEQQTQMAIDAGMLKVLGQLLRHPKSSIQKEAAWAMSNVAAGPKHHIQQLIMYNLLPPLVTLLKNAEFRVQKEAVWTVANFATGASQSQLTMLFHSGVLGPLLNLLTAPDMKIVAIILDIISFFFQRADRLHEKQKMYLLMEEVGGIEKIESLQLHQNCHISQSALNIIEKHFGEEENGDIFPNPGLRV